MSGVERAADASLDGTGAPDSAVENEGFHIGKFPMMKDQEHKINARGLSAPGPRLMVEAALARSSYPSIRVVVSDKAAADDLLDYFSDKRDKIVVDQVGGDFHVIIDFED